MSSVIDLSKWRATDHAGAARVARALLRAEARYRRRSRWHEEGRSLPEDTTDRALRLIEADRLVRDLIGSVRR